MANNDNEDGMNAPAKKTPKAARTKGLAVDAIAAALDVDAARDAPEAPPQDQKPQALSHAAPVQAEPDELINFKLIDLVRAIPPMGVGWEVKIDGKPVVIEPGQWIYDYVDEKTLLPRNCPVKPLGKDKEGMWFMDPEGGVYCLPVSAGKGHLDHLFAPMNDYLFWAWPQKKPILGEAPRGVEKPVIGWEVENFKAELARSALFKAAGLKGKFDPIKRMRGRGCWRDAGGGIVFHAGDRVLYEGVWHRPGEFGGHIYSAKPPVGRPSDAPSSVALTDISSWSTAAILGVLRTWNWERPEIDPLIVLGFIITARLGGALKSRPPIWISGEEGSGKSELFKLLSLLMCDGLLEAEEVTAAGIYQTTQDDSLAVLLDESEATEDRRKMKAVLALVRISFTGGKLSRGGGDGVPASYMLRSSFLLSGIIQASMNSADESRMNSLMIKALPPEKASGAVYDGEIMKRASADMFGRLIKDWARLEPTISRVKAALAKAGHDGRAQDSYAPLIACTHMAMFDVEIEDAGELELGMGLSWWISRLPVRRVQKSWQNLYSHILEAPIDEYRHTATASVEAILDLIRKDATGDAFDEVNKKLFPMGMHVIETMVEGAAIIELFIPVRHVGLARWLRDTVWGGGSNESGAWAGVLKQFPAHVARAGVAKRKSLGGKTTNGFFIDIGAAAKTFE